MKRSRKLLSNSRDDKNLRNKVRAPWGTQFGRSRLGTPPFQFRATKARQINPFAKRHVVFAMGNHFWKNTRQSVPLRVIDKIADHCNMKWAHSKELKAYVAEREDGFALVKPETYLVTANFKSIIPSIRYFNTTSEHFTFLFPEPKLQVGQYYTSYSGPIDGEALETAERATQTQLFRRFGIGIGYHPTHRFVLPQGSMLERTNEHLEEWFLYNKMPKKDVEIIDKTVLGDMETFMETLYDFSQEQIISTKWED